jgi:hypothetical protein
MLKIVVKAAYLCTRPLLEMSRYTIPETLFVPEFHTGTYQHTLYDFIFFHFSDSISLFRI